MEQSKIDKKREWFRLWLRLHDINDPNDLLANELAISNRRRILIGAVQLAVIVILSLGFIGWLRGWW
jgi:hypothetical protein